MSRPDEQSEKPRVSDTDSGGASAETPPLATEPLVLPALTFDRDVTIGSTPTATDDTPPGPTLED